MTECVNKEDLNLAQPGLKLETHYDDADEKYVNHVTMYAQNSDKKLYYDAKFANAIPEKLVVFAAQHYRVIVITEDDGALMPVQLKSTKPTQVNLVCIKNPSLTTAEAVVFGGETSTGLE